MRRRILAALLLLAGAAACTQRPEAMSGAQAAEADADAAGCLADGSGRFEAQVRGAMEADVDWRDAQMSCDGDIRPDGEVLRLTVAGRVDGGRLLRFILGIHLADVAEGAAQVLPTNLTVLVEGEALLFATRGEDKCAVEDLVRVPLEDGSERVSGRGYCLDPASDLAGESRLLVPTFSFTTRVRTEGDDEEEIAAQPVGLIRSAD